jgi:Zn-dependent protease
MNGQKIACIAGIDIRIHWSLLFTVVLLTFYYGPIYASLSIPWSYVLAGVTGFGLFLFVLLHELAHSLVAKFFYRQEVPCITMFMLGGVSTIENETGPYAPMKGEAVIALVGPLSSALLAAVLVATAFFVEQSNYVFAVLLLHWALINGVLAIFNMLPILPMDGGRLLRAFLRHFLGNNHAAATRTAVFFAKGFIVLGMMWALYALPLFNVVWFGFIAFMLWQGADAEERASKDNTAADRDN